MLTSSLGQPAKRTGRSIGNVCDASTQNNPFVAVELSSQASHRRKGPAVSLVAEVSTLRRHIASYHRVKCILHAPQMDY